MPFPTTPILTTFTGPNENPLSEGGNWSVPLFLGDDNLQRLNNQAAPQGGNFAGAYWSANVFNADQEAYATAGASTGDFYLSARLQSPGLVGLDGYLVTTSFGGTVRIQRYDDSSITQLGPTITQSMSSGDKMGIECIDTTISAYVDTGVGWTLIGSRVDSTYNLSGNIGIEASTGNMRLDDFGGGSIAQPPAGNGLPHRRLSIGIALGL